MTKPQHFEIRQSGDLDAVRRLVQSGFDLNSQDGRGDTMLMVAAQRGFEVIADYLLENGADVDVVDCDGSSALIHALINGWYAIANRLLERGARVKDPPQDAMSRIVEAAVAATTTDDLLRMEKCAAVLLKGGADPHGDLQPYPIVRAVEHDLSHLVRLLLEHGACPFVRFEDRSLFEVAVDRNDHDVLTVIADFERKCAALWQALDRNSVADARAAIENGAPINTRTGDGWTVLLASICDHPEIAKLLLELGADPNLCSPNGYTPLMRAAGHGLNELVQRITEKNADLLRRDNLGQTALDMCCGLRDRWSYDYLLGKMGELGAARGFEDDERSIVSPVKVQPVFITSTFTDMHAERDLLRDEVFPKLQEEASQWRLVLEPIDLRWGVETSGKLSFDEKMKEILSICLGEVERSSPFVIALLGDRYGWVAPQDSISRVIRETGSWAEPSDWSITELEIRYGLHLTGAGGAMKIYCRKSLDYEELIRQGRMTRDEAAKYSDAFDPKVPVDFVGKTLEFRTSLEASYGSSIKDYDAGWIGAAQGGIGDLDQLKTIVLDDLRSMLSQTYQVHARHDARFIADAETMASEDFIRSTETFVGRATELQTATDHCMSNNDAWLAIEGPRGHGTSFFLARLIAGLRQQEAPVLILSYLGGFDSRRATISALLRRWTSLLSYRLRTRVDIDEDSSSEVLIHTFWSLVRQATANFRVIFIVDDITDFAAEKNFDAMSWLTPSWPPNTQLLVADRGDVADSLQRRRSVVRLELPNLTLADAESIVRAACERYHRVISDEILASLLLGKHDTTKRMNVTPRWVEMAAEILNVIDGSDYASAQYDPKQTYEANMRVLLGKIAGKLPDTISRLCAYQLDRLTTKLPERFLKLVTQTMAASRFGMRTNDLRTVLENEYEYEWSDAQFATIRRHLRGQVRQSADGRWYFHHHEMRATILGELMDLDIAGTHAAIARQLAQYGHDDEIRISELFYHLIRADRPEDLAEALANELQRYNEESDSRTLVSASRDIVDEALRRGRSGIDWVVSMLQCETLDSERKAEVFGWIFDVARPLLERRMDKQDRASLSNQLILAKNTLMQPATSHAKAAKLDVVTDHSAGDAQFQLGDFDSSLAHYQAALDRLLETSPESRKDDHQQLLALILNKIGNVYRAQGKYDSAVEVRNRAEQIWQQVCASTEDESDKLSLAACLNDFGEDLFYLRDMRGAEERFQAARDLLGIVGSEDRKARDETLAVSLEWLGNLSFNRGDKRAAIDLYQEVLDLRNRSLSTHLYDKTVRLNVSEVRRKIASVAWDLGLLQEAAKAIRPALELVDGVVEEDPEWRHAQIEQLNIYGNYLRVFAENDSEFTRLLPVAEQRERELLEAYSQDHELVGRTGYLNLHIGDAYERREHKRNGELALLRAKARFELACQLAPADLGLRRGVVLSLQRLGNLTLDSPRKSVAYFEDAIRLTKELLVQLPDDQAILSDYAGCSYMLGSVYADLDDDANVRRNMMAALRTIERMEAKNLTLDSQLARVRELLHQLFPKGSRSDDASSNASKRAGGLTLGPGARGHKPKNGDKTADTVVTLRFERDPDGLRVSGQSSDLGIEPIVLSTPVPEGISRIELRLRARCSKDDRVAIAGIAVNCVNNLLIGILQTGVDQAPEIIESFVKDICIDAIKEKSETEVGVKPTIDVDLTFS